MISCNMTADKEFSPEDKVLKREQKHEISVMISFVLRVMTFNNNPFVLYRQVCLISNDLVLV